MQPLPRARTGAFLGVIEMKPKTKSSVAPEGEQSQSASRRTLWTLGELATEAQVCRRFLELEISRGRLRVTRLSNRVRVRNSDWEKYLEAGASGKAAS